MKKIIWIAGALLVLVLGYVAAGPYLTISTIKKGIVENDSEKLSEKIDFPTLRQNMKEQLNAAMMKTAATEMKDSPFAALAAGFATKMVDVLVESFATPSGLTVLMEGRKPSMDMDDVINDGNASPPQRDELFKNARFSYDSMSTFSIWVTTDDGEELRFVLNREGFSWKLVNVVIPMPEGVL
jgi:hypothetical protein